MKHGIGGGGRAPNGGGGGLADGGGGPAGGFGGLFVSGELGAAVLDEAAP